jgi:acetyl esterase/lipase
MQDLDSLTTIDSPVSFNSFTQPNLNNYTSTGEQSPFLILHAHGGGFIAHSSKSHEIYLKPWCKDLKVPIVSIDYSLAPEHAFPRASEECFYVYAWCLLNKNVLGWTGEKIICVGDSAGGVLVTNIVQRAIANEVRIPDALVPIYAPFLLSYSLSPSRLMSVMDPLLNLGILWRCLAAYCGIDFKTETEKFKLDLNLSDTSPSTPSKPKSSRSSNGSLKSSKLKIRYSKSDSSIEQNEELTTERVLIDTNNNKNEENGGVEVFENGFGNINAEDIEDDTDEKLSRMNRNKRLLKMHKIMGDSIFLIEKLRNHELTTDYCMSPLLSDDKLLAKFPPTCLIVSKFFVLFFSLS